MVLMDCRRVSARSRNTAEGATAKMSAPSFAHRLVDRLPFHYGWVILGAVCCACLSRSGPAVATLSMFVTPMTGELGWSRTAISGAVSLGGVLAAIISPLIGGYLDRHGARLILGVAVAATGITLMLLSGIQSIITFYLLYCVARMCWASPYDLGIHGAINNWFVERRAAAASVTSFMQTAGIVVMPFVAYSVIEAQGWRTGWQVIGAAVLLLGFLPSVLLLIRRPEDIGLTPDLGNAPLPSGTTAGTASAATSAPEPAFTRDEALRTRAFWVLALFTALIFPVQAGMSLHQAAHMIEQGIDAAGAATAVSLFSLTSALTGLSYGLIRRWLSLKVSLLITGLLLVMSALTMMHATTLPEAIAGGVLFGLGMGGVHVILPVAWADTFGRRSFGAIRGVALSVQVAAQAVGPLLSGVLRDATGNYRLSLACFATLSGLAALAALLIRPPRA